ncbi:MAG: hypothetical protein GX436_04080 [Synergistaceae bacterium]|nr:hypothetical protein [Synergistaceae bacterium]
MKSLWEVLEGREGRSRTQARLLKAGLTVVQVSLNIPGFPKRLRNDLFCVEWTAWLVRQRCLSLGWGIGAEIGLLNGAGYALLIGVLPGPDPIRLKQECLALEEALSWGRALDLDVRVQSGNIGREALGLPPRTCLLCGEEAKACNREGRHDRRALREIVEELIGKCAGEEIPTVHS